MTFTFDPETHIYKVGDKPVPSVTQTIEAQYHCDPWYAERGKAGHRMAEFYKRGVLDEDTLDPQLKPYLKALKKFEAEAPHVTGIGDYKLGQFAKWHLLQMGGYRELWLNGVDENGEPLRMRTKGYEVKGYHPIYRYCGTIDIVDVPTYLNCQAFIVYLQDTGKYKLEPVTDIRKHTQAFLTLVSAGYVRKEYGLNGNNTR